MPIILKNTNYKILGCGGMSLFRQSQQLCARKGVFWGQLLNLEICSCCTTRGQSQCLRKERISEKNIWIFFVGEAGFFPWLLGIGIWDSARIQNYYRQRIRHFSVKNIAKVYKKYVVSSVENPQI